MREWLKSNFRVLDYDKINGKEAVEAPNGHSKISFNIDDFIKTFGEEAPETVEDLKNKDQDDVLGLHRAFDTWKEKGILN